MARNPSRDFPTARVVSAATPLPIWNFRIRERVQELCEPVIPGLQAAAVYLVAFFPLVAIVLMAAALLLIAGYHGSP